MLLNTVKINRLANDTRVTMLFGTISAIVDGGATALFEGKNSATVKEFAYQVPMNLPHRALIIDLDAERPIRLARHDCVEGKFEEGQRVRVLTGFYPDGELSHFLAWISEAEWDKAKEQEMDMRNASRFIYRVKDGEKVVPFGTGKIYDLLQHMKDKKLDLGALKDPHWTCLSSNKWEECEAPNFTLFSSALEKQGNGGHTDVVAVAQAFQTAQPLKEKGGKKRK